MAAKAQSFVDVVLGEAVSGTRAQRYEDMKAIASAVVNRAEALGVSPEDVISAENQFDAYGKSLPAGADAFRSLAEQAIAEVQSAGPTHTGMFYATPAATQNLPSGLQPVAQTAGHVYYDDPQNRAIATAKGYVTPNKGKGLGLAALAPNGLIDRISSPINAAVDYAQGLYSRFSPVGDMNVAPMPSAVDAGLQFAHANQRNIAPGLEDSLMGVSAELGQPLGITSGLRSPTYNAGIGGAKQSYHTKGLAADIDMSGMTPAQRQDLVTSLTQRGIGGLIAYSKSPNMMHVDMRARDPAASPHFMFDKTAARMPNAPDWFKEMASYGGIKTPDAAPTPTSRDLGLSQPVDMASQAAARSQMGQTMAQAGVSNLAGKQTASPTRPDNFSAPGQLVGAKAGGLGGLGGVATAPAQDPYSAFEAQRAAAFSSMPAPSFSPASISPNPVSSVASLSAPATASINPTAISSVASMPQSLTPSFTPTVVSPTTFKPTVAPMVTPTPVRVSPVTPRSVVAPQPTNSPQPAQVSTPSYSVADVYAGKAPAGYQAQATGGNLVSRDPETGNTSITNSYGVTTVTDPSGRQLGSLKGAPPGLVGAALGAALGGIPGAISGYSVGNRLGGKKSGGLGGLGGWLSDLFGGSSDGGGGSSGSTSSGGRSSGGGRAGADRDHSGNR